MTSKIESQRLMVPALAGLYDLGSGLVYPLFRFVAGLWLVPHGAQKLFGWAGGDINGTAAFFTKIGLEPALTLAYLTGVVEFFGGILVAIGLLTRPAAAACIVLLAIATFHVHTANGFFWTGGGYEYPLMWMILMIGIFFRGGGNLSVDERLSKQF